MTYFITCPDCQQEGLDPRYSPIACIHCKKELPLDQKETLGRCALVAQLFCGELWRCAN